MMTIMKSKKTRSKKIIVIQRRGNGNIWSDLAKTFYLLFANWLRRVPIDTVMPGPIGAEKVEDKFVEPSDEDEDRFKEEEVSLVELEKDLEMSALMKRKLRVSRNNWNSKNWPMKNYWVRTKLQLQLFLMNLIPQMIL